MMSGKYTYFPDKSRGLASKNSTSGRKDFYRQKPRAGPNPDESDKAILKLLPHFLVWAGLYPDPGSDRELDSESIFALSEQHQISGKELFSLAARVMGQVRTIVD